MPDARVIPLRRRRTPAHRGAPTPWPPAPTGPRASGPGAGGRNPPRHRRRPPSDDRRAGPGRRTSRRSRAPTGAAERRAARVGAQGGVGAGLPAPPDHRRRTRSTSSASTPTSPRTCCCALLRPLYEQVLPGRGARPRERARRRAARWSSPTTPGTVPLDSVMTQVALLDHHPAHRHLRMLGADLVFPTPFVGELARKTGTTLACNADAERLLASGELVGVWPEGFKGIGKPFTERYKLQRFGRGGFVSAALRSRRADHARARSSAPRRSTRSSATSRRWPGCSGLPYVPVTPTFPLLGPLGADPAAHQVDHRVRRADRHRRATAPARPTTRCSSSTSPTRCARRSSRRSTGC